MKAGFVAGVPFSTSLISGADSSDVSGRACASVSAGSPFVGARLGEVLV